MDTRASRCTRCVFIKKVVMPEIFQVSQALFGSNLSRARDEKGKLKNFDLVTFNLLYFFNEGIFIMVTKENFKL
jgi:hypothetical protein